MRFDDDVMNPKPNPNRSKRGAPNDAFTIPDPVWPSQNVVTDILLSLFAEKVSPERARVPTDNPAKTDYFKTIVSVATNAWRAKTAILNTTAGEMTDAMKNFEHIIDAIYHDLADFGVAIHDHTGEVYDEQQSIKVVASTSRSGLDRKLVTNTRLPSISWNNRLLQIGEVEIATPQSKTPAQSQVESL